MSGRRSFGDLSPREVLALAMSVERNNAERFDSLAEMFRDQDPEIEALLRTLHDDERGHLEMLWTAWRSFFGDEEPPPVDEADVLEVVEAVDLDDGEHAIFDAIDKQRTLELVVASERSACDLYRRALDATTDPRLAAVYQRLLDLELEHESAVRARQEEGP